MTTQQEISEIMGLSRERVRQLEKSAMDKLRQEINLEVLHETY